MVSEPLGRRNAAPVQSTKLDLGFQRLPSHGMRYGFTPGNEALQGWERSLECGVSTPLSFF
jgi:hypothetical protein